MIKTFATYFLFANKNIIACFSLKLYTLFQQTIAAYKILAFKLINSMVFIKTYTDL
jgi:hypothetical protein